MRQFQRCVAVAALLLTGWAAPLPARAAPAAGHTYTVNSTVDEPDADPTNGVCASTPSGKCTLRAAIMQANFVSGPDTIELPAGTYTLTRTGYDDTAQLGDLDISDDLTLQGAGSGVTIVDGNGAVTGDRVFQILSTAQNVTLDGMTIRNGHAADEAHNNGDSGGGIQTEGLSTTLNDVILEGNIAYQGGGLATNQPGVLVKAVMLLDSQVYSNTATSGDGGGLFVNNAVLILNASQLHGNMAGNHGGGLYVELGQTAEAIDSTISDNSAGQDGGGLYAYNLLPTLSNSTVSGNVAGRDGGGLFLSYAQTKLVNSTVSGNVASHLGGGLYADSGQAQLLNDTIAFNLVQFTALIQPGLGGGMYLTHTVTLEAVDSIIAKNRRVNPPRVQALDDCSSQDARGGLYALYYDLFTTLADCIVSSGAIFGNIVGQDPLLGPLQDNGGSTQTQALLLGSPAKDAGAPVGCLDGAGSIFHADQRGAPRPVVGCDIGAYEVVPEADLSVGQRDSPDPAQVGAPLTYTVVVSNTGPAPATGVILTDTLPASAGPPIVASSQGSCLGTLVVTCNQGLLASSDHITVTVVVTPTAAGVMTNLINVTANEFDPALANNTSGETTAVVNPRRLYLPLVRR